MISEPTPVTISIIIRLSWSVRSVRPKWYGPAESHVHDVVVWIRSPADFPRSDTNATIAAAKAPIVVRVERYAAPRRERRVPASAIAAAAASGRPRQSHAAAFILGAS